MSVGLLLFFITAIVAVRSQNFPEVKLLLFNKNNDRSFELHTLSEDPRRLSSSRFDPNLDTKVIIHGFFDDMRFTDWMLRMKDEILRQGNYNVILVNWGLYNKPSYADAIQNAKGIGREIADFIKALVIETKTSPSKFHVIGHSLGAHLAGFIGKNLPGLGRITGLDPAGPMFYSAGNHDRLDSSDANFVDVIHSDAARGILEGLGGVQSLGHVDFFPNGGDRQPGCNMNIIGGFLRGGIPEGAKEFICDHFRAVDLFMESIRKKEQCEFVGVKCRNWSTFKDGRCSDCGSNMTKCAVMGFYANEYSERYLRPQKDRYYLKTGSQSPFCVNQYQVVLKLGQGEFGGNDVLILDLEGPNIISRIRLNERREDFLRPDGAYTYLVTTKNEVEEVEEATLRWEPQMNGGQLNLEELQINPVTMENRRSKSLSVLRSNGGISARKPVTLIKDERKK